MPSSSSTTRSTTPRTRGCSASGWAAISIEGKATLPLIRACAAEPKLRERLALLVDGKAETEAVAAEVIAAVKRTGGVDAARGMAREHTRAALAALEKVPDGIHRRALREAAGTLTERAF